MYGPKTTCTLLESRKYSSVGPHLSERIDPEPAREPAHLPAPFDGGSVHGKVFRTNSHRSLPESRPNVDVRRVDELGKSCGIYLTARPQLHVAPALARSLQQASRVLQQRTKEEA